MHNYRVTVCILALNLAMFGCGSKKKYGDVSATLMKSKTVSTSLVENTELTLTDTGSTVQSFTPTSLKLPIFRVSLCEGNSSCQSVYTCSANTVADCGVELSKIDEFVNALNTSAAEIEEGTNINYVSVQYCPDGDTSGIQNITVNGTVKIRGVDYATDPTSGLVLGTSGKDAALKVSGGCGSFYQINPAVTVSKGEATTVKMFFDASLYTYGGISGGASNLSSYPDDGAGCAGSSSAYVCAPVITIVATVDSGTPSTEQYLLTNIDSSESNSPTAKVALYFNSSGTPVGGIQNAYRLSGSSVTWGTAMNGGLGLIPKTVDAETVSFGEPEGSISLADWFKAFKRSSHTGTYTYAGSGGTVKEGAYKATKL